MILIASSIVLLLALQVLWLTNSYEKAYYDLRRETNGLFRNTVLALRDSFLLQGFEKIPNDSTETKLSRAFTYRHLKDTATRGNMRIRSSQVQIYISTDRSNDSLSAILRPLSARIQEGKIDGGNFVFRMRTDSLPEDSLRNHFNKALTRVGFAVPFEIKHSSFVPTPIQVGSGNSTLFKPPGDELLELPGEARAYSNTLYSDWVRFDPIHRYAVELHGFRTFLLGQITPQILFSLFLTLLTTAAFVVMYRSMLAQQRLMDLKNDFISNITHELKTPVTTVGVALEAIKNFKGQNNPELTSEYLTIAQNELNRLNILTDKILKTAIFEDKGVEFKAEPVDMNQLIEQVINSMKLVFEKHKATVAFEKKGQDFQLLGGPVHLTSVIYNLLDNALKYSPVNPEIMISLNDEGDELVIKVQDKGIGIAPEFRKKVFEKFFRVPTGDIHNIKGYGLGLSYVESVVKSHHGSIAVDSAPGSGSVFTIRLPKK